MSHRRIRYLKQTLLQDLKWSPAVGIFGMRQTGKTTLVEEITKELGGDYDTFDRESTLQSSQAAPFQFLDRKKLLGIDEVQKGVWIFPALKDLIGTKRKPGQFILTGSIRFTLKKEVRESLTGRVLMHELLPFGLKEAENQPSSAFLGQLFHFLNLDSTSVTSKTVYDFEKLLLKNRAKNHTTPTPAQCNRFATSGGLPIPCFTRNEARRHAWFVSYIETLITRDLPLFDEKLATITLRQGQGFLRILALLQGQEVLLSQLIAHTGLNRKTAQTFLTSLEALCIIDRIPPELFNPKSSRHFRVEWKDIGLWNFILGTSPHQSLLSEASLKLFISQEWRSQIQNSSQPIQWNFYRSRDGAEIPWIFTLGKWKIGILHLADETPRRYDYRTLKNWVEAPQNSSNSSSNSLGVILGPEKTKPHLAHPRIWVFPYSSIF